MPFESQVVPMPVPGLRVVRFWTDELYSGVKEGATIARVEEGRSEWWTRGKSWRLGPGSHLLCQAGDVHKDLARAEPGRLQIVVLPKPIVERVLASRTCVLSHLAPEDPRSRPFSRLHDAVRRRSDRLEIEVALAEAVDSLGDLQEFPKERSRAVRRAIEVLRERFAHTVTLEELADHAGLDKFHLCRAFRAQVGLPPHAYQTRLRIMRAKEMLSHGERPSVVAFQVGFYDQSQMHRHFRRLVGVTPAAYARSVA